MLNTQAVENASTYMNYPLRPLKQPEKEETKRRVEPTAPTHTGKQFNKNASEKSNFDSPIDISI